jgi:hypothetical protein
MEIGISVLEQANTRTQVIMTLFRRGRGRALLDTTLRVSVSGLGSGDGAFETAAAAAAALQTLSGLAAIADAGGRHVCWRVAAGDGRAAGCCGCVR